MIVEMEVFTQIINIQDTIAPTWSFTAVTAAFKYYCRMVMLKLLATAHGFSLLLLICVRCYCAKY
jgi:hypothetical protein